MQIGILPYAGVDIMTFELLKEYLLERYDGMPPPWAILGAGMTSSSIAQFASYPLALVRTRMQVDATWHRMHKEFCRASLTPVSEQARLCVVALWLLFLLQ